MAKPTARPYSQYSLDAMALLGLLVREGRVVRRLTASDAAARAGISRSLLQRIERGDAGCAIGAVFELAAICGVSLFEQEPRALGKELGHAQEKMSLLPQAVRQSRKAAVNDDF